MLLVLESNKNKFDVEYADNPIPLLGKKEIGLKGASLWYSWYNINKDFNNNTFKYSADNGVTWTLLTIPEGNYDTKELNNYLEMFFTTDDPPIVFDTNDATN